MDPHSTRAQFNQRTPKAGPKMSVRMRRPIASNSRVELKQNMYLSVVTNALLVGAPDAFNELVSQFTRTPVDPPQIRLWLVALSHVVSRLERTHAVLVDAIVNMPWMTLDSPTVKSYTVFVGMLLSARPEYLSLVLAKIAHGFTHQSGIDASTSTAPLTRRLIYDRLHYLLRHLLTLIPTLPSTLQPLLVRSFPHKRQNELAQTTYIRNILRLSSYCPELADKILATIVDRAIQIDVEIQIELEELEEEEDISEHDVFELDPFDVVVGQEELLDGSDSGEDDGDTFSDLSSEAGDDLDEPKTVEIPTNVKHIKEMVKKLDAILLLLFQHFDRTRAASLGPNPKSIDSPLELPPLPPLEMGTPGMHTPLTPMFGPPYTGQNPFDWTTTFDSQQTLVASSQSQTQRPDKPPPPKDKTPLRTQFHALLSIFDRTILRTFKSRYTQFLLFWYTSLDPEFSDIFQGMLVDRALMPGGSAPAHVLPRPNDAYAHMLTPEVTRAAAASYIGSFVSRAMSVDRDGARRVVSILCEYLCAHLDGVDEALRVSCGPAPTTTTTNSAVSAILASGQHTVFYAVAQAVFLIFCFRWRDLTTDIDADADADVFGFGMEMGSSPRSQPSTKKDKWMPELAVLKRAVASILNPLKVCSSNVVMQFARIARATDFIYCYSILDANRRSDGNNNSPSRGPAVDSSTANVTSVLNPTALYELQNAELNTFFPFDPYRLPKSNVFIQGVYREWAAVAYGDDEEEEDDDEEEQDVASMDLRRLDIPRTKKESREEDDGGLGESLGTMSISPARVSMSVSMRG